MIDGNTLFEWRIAGAPRNITIVAAALTLQAARQPAIICRATASPRLSVLCGAGRWSSVAAATYTAILNITLCGGGSGQCSTVSATGAFIRGLLPAEWGAAEWIGLVNPNATAAQYRAGCSVQSWDLQQRGT